MKDDRIDVSVVIVCMNNLKNLYPCLDSIYNTTKTVRIEVLVVAYLFSLENLNDLREKYSQVQVIESNEIRGFSENNNLALRQANGKYAFILNDDTYFDSPIIDVLFEDFKKVPQETAVVSPSLWHVNFKKRAIGYMPIDSFPRFLFRMLGIYFPNSKYRLKYINQDGLFQTYGFSGCAFLIRMDVFRNLNFFDERYFFSPEDIALSKLVNDRGYKCYVDADIELNHLQQTTFSKTSCATFPALIRGTLLFRCECSIFYKIILRICFFIKFLFVVLLEFPKKHTEVKTLKIKRYKNAIIALFSRKTPKELFIMFYRK